MDNNGKQRRDMKKNAGDIFRLSDGYHSLKVFQIATLIYDITVRFTKFYISPKSRTQDQMEQAARSGKQNIAEGSVDAATSANLEINLYNIARGSFAELCNDYEDYLRQNNKPVWEKQHPFAREFISRRVQNNQKFRAFIQWAEENTYPVSHRSTPLKSVLVANAAIFLINAEMYWLKKLIYTKMEQYLQNGGFGENMRLARRKEQRKNNPQHRKNNHATR